MMKNSSFFRAGHRYYDVVYFIRSNYNRTLQMKYEMITVHFIGHPFAKYHSLVHRYVRRTAHLVRARRMPRIRMDTRLCGCRHQLRNNIHLKQCYYCIYLRAGRDSSVFVRLLNRFNCFSFAFYKLSTKCQNRIRLKCIFPTTQLNC